MRRRSFSTYMRRINRERKMPPKVDDQKAFWTNTQKTFKSQNTQLINKIAGGEAEIKRCLDNPTPTIKEYINCEALCDGCKAKLSLLDGYILKMADLVCWGETSGEDSVESREE